MSWKEVGKRGIHSWFTHWIIIFVLSYFIAIFFDLYIKYPFSINTLLWMTSTIIQAFGAMIAIIIVVGLHQLRETENKLISLAKEINKMGEESQKIMIEAFKDLRGDRRRLLDRVNDPVQAIVLLLALSLIVMAFINPSVVVPNWLLAYIFIVLVIWSLYCLQFLVNRIIQPFYSK